VKRFPPDVRRRLEVTAWQFRAKVDDLALGVENDAKVELVLREDTGHNDETFAGLDVAPGTPASERGVP
jgi:hypothetical protein